MDRHICHTFALGFQFLFDQICDSMALIYRNVPSDLDMKIEKNVIVNATADVFD